MDHPLRNVAGGKYNRTGLQLPSGVSVGLEEITDLRSGFCQQPAPVGYQRLPPNWASETFSDLLEQNRSFEQWSMIQSKEFVLEAGDRSDQVRGMRVSANLGLRPTDPLTFGAITLLLGCVALVACWLTAWRASKVDPLVALRYQG